MNSFEIITLDRVPIGSKCYVIDISNLDKEKANRMYDFGFVNQAEIIVLFHSMSKNTVAYKIKGSVIALRNDDAKNIKVSLRR